MTESLVGQDSQQQLQPLCALKTLVETSGKKDQLTLNNMVFLVQKILSFQLYNDFKGFGKLGVTSPSLGWQFNKLSDRWEELPGELESDIVKQSRDIAIRFKNISYRDIGLLACYLFDEEFLNQEEKSIAKAILATLK